MSVNNSIITPENKSADLISLYSKKTPQSVLKLIRQSSVSGTQQGRNRYIANQHRQNLLATNNAFFVQCTSSFSVPVLINTMNTFFQATQSMEDEIMLPSKLKDMPVDYLASDNIVHPESWYETYSFIRDMRNQLRSIYPFAEDNDENNSKEHPGEDVSNGEEIIIPNQDSISFSSTSADEYEQSSTSSGATSYDALKDELKFHYYGLFRSLDNLTSIANRVTEKYKEEYIS